MTPTQYRAVSGSWFQNKTPLAGTSCSADDSPRSGDGSRITISTPKQRLTPNKAVASGLGPSPGTFCSVGSNYGNYGTPHATATIPRPSLLHIGAESIESSSNCTHYGQQLCRVIATFFTPPCSTCLLYTSPSISLRDRIPTRPRPSGYSNCLCGVTASYPAQCGCGYIGHGPYA